MARDRKSEAGTPGGVLGGEQLVEDLRERRGRDAARPVAHGEDGARAGVAGVDLDAPIADAGVLVRVERVGHQVDQHLAETRRVPVECDAALLAEVQAAACKRLRVCRIGQGSSRLGQGQGGILSQELGPTL